MSVAHLLMIVVLGDVETGIAKQIVKVEYSRVPVEVCRLRIIEAVTSAH